MLNLSILNITAGIKVLRSRAARPFIYGSIIAASLAGCKSGEEGPDVSGVRVTMSTQRLDLDMRQLDTAQLATGLQRLSAKYPGFLDFYLDDAIRKRFIPTTMEAMTYRGTVYGLPLNYKVITLIYNKKLVPTPPKTSGELVTVAKKLTDKKAGRFGLA